MRRLQRVRRTFADTLVTLLVVVFAITATTVGGPPGPMGRVIGSVSGAGSIVPILIVGSGVDYVIHLNAADRNGLASVTLSRPSWVAAFVSSAVNSRRRPSPPPSASSPTFSPGDPPCSPSGILTTVGILAAFVFANLLFPAARGAARPSCRRSSAYPCRLSPLPTRAGSTASSASPPSSPGVPRGPLSAWRASSSGRGPTRPTCAPASAPRLRARGFAGRAAAVERPNASTVASARRTQVLVNADITDPAVGRDRGATTAAARFPAS